MYSRCVAVIGVFLVAFGHAPSAVSQSYPTGPIRLVVPFPAGGPADIVSRIIGQKLQEVVAQQVVMDNRAGAGGIVGTDLVAKSRPDGYTLLVGTLGTHGINSALYKKLPYDPVHDFAPITPVFNVTNLLVVHPSLPVKSVTDLIDLARSRPGQLTFASSGVGTSQHLAGELFNSMAKVNMLHVPYKGGGPALPDLVAGRVSLMFIGYSAISQYIASNKLRPIAVTTLGRLPALPDLPTIAEAGLPGYEVDLWQGVLAPAGTPKAIVTKLNAELARVTSSSDTRERLSSLGATPMHSTPEEFSALIHSALAKFEKLVKEAMIPQQ